MKIGFFTDPHLGAKRSAHSTTKGQENYREKLFDAAMEASKRHEITICGGDLFDKFSNSEEVIYQGIEVVKNCRLVLAGNHDIANRTDVFGSLNFIEWLDGEKISINPIPGEPWVETPYIEDFELVTVPHCLSQDVFEASIRQACTTGGKLLLLHCNVGDGYGPVEGDGSSLWLTSELQELVLANFKLCLVGHEHTPRELHGGRIVVMGNTFPLTFGEIAPRYTYTYDTETGTLEKELLFDPFVSYLKVNIEEFPLISTTVTIAILVEIVGELDKAKYAEFSRQLYSFWKLNPHLLAVKNSTTMVGAEAAVVEADVEKLTLPEIVGRAIKVAGFEEEARACAMEMGL